MGSSVMAGEMKGVDSAHHEHLADARVEWQVWMQRADGLRMQGRLQDAMQAYAAVIGLAPENAAAHNNLAVLLGEAGHFNSSLRHFETALALSGDDACICYNLGSMLDRAGRLDDAVSAYRCALQIDPDLPSAHREIAVLLHEAGALDEAERHLLKFIGGEPGNARAFANLATILKDQGRVPEAIAACSTAIALDSSCRLARSNLILLQSYQRHSAAMNAAGAALRGVDAVFGRSGPALVRSRNGCLKVGIVSADFHDHALMFFFEPVLAGYDRTRFSITCYDCGSLRDDAHERLRRYGADWRYCGDGTDDEIAAMVEADGIDVLIDLAGHTAHNRLGVFARRSAPIQVTWLGWPGSTGLSAMDYCIVDRHIAEGKAVRDQYTEELLALPDTWLCYRPPALAPAIALRHGVEGVTFGSFNGVYKLSDEVVATWSEILKVVPGSTLILAGTVQGRTREELRRRFVARGANPGSLEFVEPCSFADFLALHARVDIALDPFPFNGGTTTLHSLWMGVPVLTLAGETHAGRMGYSIMKNLRLDELIAGSSADYVRRAAALASDPRCLAELRHTLRSRIETSPLRREAEFVKNFEEMLVSAMHLSGNAGRISGSGTDVPR